MPGRYGGVIEGEGSWWAREVKTVELEGPLRGRILCIEVDGVVTHACVRRRHLEEMSVQENRGIPNRRKCRGAGKRRSPLTNETTGIFMFMYIANILRGLRENVATGASRRERLGEI